MDRVLKCDRYLAIGIVASVFAGIAIAVIHNSGLDLDITQILVLVPIIVLSFSICSEHVEINMHTLLMAILGLLSGVIYYDLFYLSSKISVHTSNGLIGYFMYFLNLVVIVPIFEELVVRRFLFFGAAKYVGPILSALIVSAIFSIAHTGAMLWAFIFSLFMCILAHRGMDTLNRAAIHGAFNAALGTLWIFGARMF